MDQEQYIKQRMHIIQESIKESMAHMEKKMDMILAQVEDKATIHDIEMIHERLKMLEQSKMDSKDFLPYKRNLDKILGLMVSAIVGGILYLVINHW